MDRIRFLYPSTGDTDQAAAVMVHSKVMIVDDRILRVGSANLNNRSMGADSECDLAFEATSEAHRQYIARLRRQLIGHFCGVDERDIASNEADLFGFLDRLADAAATKSLQPIDPAATAGSMATVVQPVADPREPLHLDRAANRMWTARTILAVSGLAAALAGLALAWQYTSLRDFTDVGFVSSVISQPAWSQFAPLLAIAAFVVGGLVVFPVLVLIAATAAALGPWMGFVSAATGVLLSSAVLFGIGRVLGHVRLQRLLGRRSSRVQSRIIGKGVVAVAMIRMVPIAPFSIVNVVAGASKLSLRDFMLGTALGMLPGIAVMAALGAQIADLARHASLWNAVLLGACDPRLDRALPWRAVPGDVDGGAKTVTSTMRIMTWNVHGMFRAQPEIRSWTASARSSATGRLTSWRCRRSIRAEGPMIPLPCWRGPSATTASMQDRSSPRMAITDRCCSAAGRLPSRRKFPTSPIRNGSRAGPLPRASCLIMARSGSLPPTSA